MSELDSLEACVKLAKHEHRCASYALKHYVEMFIENYPMEECVVYDFNKILKDDERYHELLKNEEIALEKVLEAISKQREYLQFVNVQVIIR